jgi:hypothetical protein
MNNVVNTMPYIRSTRDFPIEVEELSSEINRAYLDIAQKLNDRTIGLFPTTRSAINGEAWYVEKNQKQQAFRQVYPFTAAGNIPHNIDFARTVERFTKCQGSYSDGTNFYGVIYASSVPIAGQISFYITPTNIVVLDGGAPLPITKGIIVLEWLSRTSTNR